MNSTLPALPFSALSGQGKRARILRVVEEFTRLHGYPPTFREIGRIVGLRSSNSVHYHVHRLIREERLSGEPSKPRTLRVVR